MGFAFPPSTANQAPFFFVLTDPRKKPHTFIKRCYDTKRIDHMTTRAQTEPAAASGAGSGPVTGISHSLATPRCHRRHWAQLGRQPWARAGPRAPSEKQLASSFSSHPYECALVFIVSSWKNHGLGLSFSACTATSEEIGSAAARTAAAPKGRPVCPGSNG